MTEAYLYKEAKLGRGIRNFFLPTARTSYGLRKGKGAWKGFTKGWSPVSKTMLGTTLGAAGVLGTGALIRGTGNAIDNSGETLPYLGGKVLDGLGKLWSGVSEVAGDDWKHFNNYYDGEIDTLKGFTDPNSNWGRGVNNFYDASVDSVKGLGNLPGKLWGGFNDVGRSIGDGAAWSLGLD